MTKNESSVSTSSHQFRSSFEEDKGKFKFKAPANGQATSRAAKER